MSDETTFDKLMKLPRPRIGPDREYVGLDPAIIAEAAKIDRKRAEEPQEENIATALEKFLTDPRYTNEVSDIFSLLYIAAFIVGGGIAVCQAFKERKKR